MTQYETIMFDVSDKIATVTLNRPEKLNAFIKLMTDELVTVFQDIKGRADISVVILKGAGRSFSSGHDVTSWEEHPPFAVEGQFFDEQVNIINRWDRYRKMLWDIPQPVIAQVQGYCLTVGLELAMNCDLVVAADDAKFSWRALGGGGLYMHLWPWLVGVRKTKELLYTGRYVSGTEAESLGMVNKALPLAELDDFVREMATQIAKVPADQLALDKQGTNKCLELMGAREGVDYSLVLHAVSHTTEASRQLVEVMHSSEWKQGVKARDSRYGQ